MRLAALLGLALLAMPAAQAQTSPPSNEMHLQFLVAGRDQAIYVERMTPKISGSTVEVWVYTALPEGKASSGWWSRHVVDCTARTVATGNVSIVAKDFTIRAEAPNTANPPRAITPTSTDQSLANFFCTSDDFQFHQPPVNNVRAAWTQAQDVFRSLPQPT